MRWAGPIPPKPKDTMNAKQLFTDKLRPTGVWYCGNCGKVCTSHHQISQQWAENCCTVRPQNECLSCGKLVDHLFCGSGCQDAYYLETAEEVPDNEGEPLWYGDVMFSDWDELKEIIGSENPEDYPKFVFASYTNHLLQVTAERIVDMSLENQAESETGDGLVGVEDLKMALKVFYQVNSAVCSIFRNDRKKVRVPIKEILGAN